MSKAIVEQYKELARQLKAQLDATEDKISQLGEHTGDGESTEDLREAVLILTGGKDDELNS